MKKYKCEICNKYLSINTYKSRKMHINGSKHKLLKETYFMELMERNDIKNNIKSHKARLGKNYEFFLGKQNYGFRLPPCTFNKDFTIPPCPKNFRLPKFFDFTDAANFCSDINKNLQNILEKNFD
ncbi:u1 small nuclear ribonucleoprotein [Vairimorpha ceranae]|uniref:U1 small nuclear ribonucleoprotein n=1 Tax=Vairimorpha ceranae TaxID=40302 RepID=A0A0F9WRV5_9MICR|nr:u1 small nuclear ribonucleoprotein [Vairimorpha ceranae]KAF5141133.1 hypothetical protein G9O61_00g004490 [Vairimorpha ceranae]KKO75623.1 u1 small nuclear ribonucleoprotein [Vairimorpha ceranae]